MNSTLYVADADHPQGFRAATYEEILAAARRALASRVRRGAQLSDSSAVRDDLRAHLADREHETFVVLFLDSRQRLIALSEMFRGTIDGASVHPREIVKESLRHNAAAVIFAHNHPSGIAEPSHADELITRRLRDALALVDIRVLEHLVVASQGVTSMVDRGLL